VRTNLLMRGGDSRQIGRWARPVPWHHEPRWQAPTDAVIAGIFPAALMLLDGLPIQIRRRQRVR
jgi:hypothetical protein